MSDRTVHWIQTQKVEDTTDFPPLLELVDVSNKDRTLQTVLPYVYFKGCKIFFSFLFPNRETGSCRCFGRSCCHLREELAIILFIGYVGMKCLFSFKLSLHNYAHFTLREKCSQNSFES